MLWLLLWMFGGDVAPPPTPADSEGRAAAPVPAERNDGSTPPAPRATPPATSDWLEHLAEPLPAPIAAAADDPRALVLTGRLTVRQRPWIHPAGVSVRLTRHWLDTVLPTAASDAALADEREPRAVTGSDGTFALRLLPAAGELFFLIDRGGVWMDFQRVPPLRPTGGTDLGDVFLDDRGSVCGQVVDPYLQPVAGVQVRAVDEVLNRLASGLEDLRADRTCGAERFPTDGSTAFGPLPPWVAHRDGLLPFPIAYTDADGHFELRGLRPGEQDLFLRFATGHGSLRGVQVAGLRTTDVGSIRLQPDEPVQLTFQDLQQEPWIGASIALVDDQLGFGPTVERTSARGEVSFSVASPATTRVLFAHPGGGPWFSIGMLADMPPRVIVPAPAEVRVRLLDAGGQPLVGGRVRLFVTGAQFRAVDHRLPSWMQPTEQQPSLHVGKGTGNLVAVASHPDCAPAIAVVDSSSVAELTLLPLQHITVRVRDSGGQAVAGATVRVQVHEHPDLQFRGAQWAALANDRARIGTTDESGQIEVPVWGTWFSLQATHPDYAPSAGPHFVPRPDSVVDLTLRRPGAITGVLTMQHRAAPAGFRIRVRQTAPPGNPLDGSGFLADHVAVTGEDGSFAFRELCAGIWELQPEFPPLPSIGGARSPAANFCRQQVLLDEGQSMHCVIEANREMLTTPQLRGVVRQNGAALAGALVRVRELGPAAPKPRKPRPRKPTAPPKDAEPLRVHWQQQCTTDWFGDFDFANLEPRKEYELRVDVPCNGRMQFVRRYVVRVDEDTRPGRRIDVDLATGSVRLQCSTNGRPFAGRMVRLRQQLDHGDEGACFELLTDELGECTADGLPEGTWTLEPMFGGNFEPTTFAVQRGTIGLCVAQFLP